MVDFETGFNLIVGVVIIIFMVCQIIKYLKIKQP